MEIKKVKLSFKKYISVILVLLLLFSCFGQSFAFAATSEKISNSPAVFMSYSSRSSNCMEVLVDTYYTVEAGTDFVFTATRNGYYMITSYGEDDPLLIFEGDEYDDYQGRNFRHVFYGYEGESYYGTITQFESDDPINFDICYYGSYNPNHHATSGDFYVSSGDFYAVVSRYNECIITDYIGEDTVVTIPEYIGEYLVTGLNDDVYWYLRDASVINIPSGISSLSFFNLSNLEALEQLNIAPENECYVSVNGVVYDNNVIDMLFCPRAYSGVLTIPATVVEIEAGVLSAINGITDVVIEGNNNNLYYSDGVLYNASVTRAIKEFAASGDYIMPETVVSIDPYAFADADNIESVKLSPNVVEISYYAFADCDALAEVVIPEGVEAVGEYSFTDCEVLEDISIGESVWYLGSGSFQNNIITDIVLPDSLREVGYGVFYMCQELKNVDLGSGLSSIGNDMFAYCSALEKIEFPANIEYIEYSAFYRTGLKSVIIPDNIKYIESYSFGYCDQLESVYIGEGLIYMSGSFIECKNLKEAYIGSKVQDMSVAFHSCPNLEKVIFAEGFKGSMDYAFENCEKLSTVDLPASVVEISYANFRNCTDLEYVKLPENLERVAAHSFDDTAWFDSQPDGDVYLDKVLYAYKDSNVDSSYYGTYHDPVPKNYTLDVKEGTEIIADCAYALQNNLKKIVLPDGLEYIGQMAFYDSNVKTVYIRNSVVEISYYAFGGCDKLEDVYFSGTEEEWDKIDIKDGNEYLLRSKIHFNHCVHRNAIELPGQAATCGKYGYTSGTYCNGCETWISGHKLVSATGNHIYRADVVPATCESFGYTIYTCTQCAYSYKGSVTGALGHMDSNTNGKCDRCNGDLTDACSCSCHTTGVKQVVYVIMRFFWRFLKIKSTCACGVAHY